MLAFIVATPLQLFNSLNILNSNKSGQKADLFVLDFAVDMKKYFRSIDQNERINEVFHLDKLCKRKGKAGVIKDYILTDKTTRKALKGKKYTDLYTTWIGDRSTLIFSKLKANNNNLRLHFYEEGIGVYTQDICNYSKNIIKMFKILGLKYDKDYLEDVCVYRPELICEDIKQPTKAIKTIDKKNNKQKDFVNKTFSFNQVICYEQKLIYLENCFYRDESDIRYLKYKSLDQIQLLHRVEQLLGQNNLIVRKHPITKGTVYEDNGFRLDKLDDVPWELILMNGDFRDKILMTILSTAVFSPKIMFNEEPTVIILAKAYYNEFKNIEPWAEELWTLEFQNLINKVSSMYNNPSKVIVPETFKDLYKVLEIL